MILHSKFDMQAALMSVKTHRINRLYVVGLLPIIEVQPLFIPSRLLGTGDSCCARQQPIPLQTLRPVLG